jgi:hypothetical protein
MSLFSPYGSDRHAGLITILTLRSNGGVPTRVLLALSTIFLSPSWLNGNVVSNWSNTEEARVSVFTFKYDVPLEQTTVFEAVYHKAEQLDLSKKQKFWDAPGSIFVWMFVGGELAGETYGIPLTSTIAGLTDLPMGENVSAIHCYSNTILPSFQKQGLGTILKAHWLGLAAGKGFDTVYGYARPGASQALNGKFGAVFLDACPDWCGTGEEYKMYRLALK